AGARPSAGARRARRQGPRLRLPVVRQLRAGPPGVRLPADLSQAAPERPLRRHPARPLRGDPGATVHLGRRVRAPPPPPPPDLPPSAPAPDRSPQGPSSWLNYLLERDRRPAGPTSPGEEPHP